MKRLMLVLITLVLACGIVFAGGSQEGSGSAEQSSGEAKGEHWNLKTTVVDPEGTPVWNTLEYMKKEVEDKYGNVTIDLYPNGVLSNRSNPTLIQQLQSGVVEFGPVSTLPYTNVEPKFSLVSLPFLFDSLETAIKFYKSDIADDLLKNLESKGIKGLALWPRGFRQISNSKRPIKTPDDLKGLKMRIPEIKLFMSVFQTLGATTVPLASGEIYSALQMKTVDGQDNGITVVDSWKFYEVQDYYTLVNYSTDAYVVGMSLDTWNRMPTELQNVLQEVTRDCIDYIAKEESKKRDASLKKLEDHLEIYVPTEAERKLFIDAVKPVYEEYRSVIGSDLMDRAFDFLGIE